jgi:hypothetical protein
MSNLSRTVCPHCGEPLSNPTATHSPLVDNSEFVTDLARFAENIVTEQGVRKKWRLADADWEELGKNDRLVEAIELEKTRRIRNGAHAREKAQLVFVKTPDMLEKILDDKNANPRHVVEASRELRAIAATGPEAAAAEDRFTIVINLGADEKLVIDQPRRPTPVDVTSQKWLEKDE